MPLRAGGDKKYDVGPPTHFISHAWRYKFKGLVEQIDRHVDVGLRQLLEGHVADLCLNPGWGAGMGDGHSADHPVGGA